MYLYLLPLARSTSTIPSEILIPTSDGGVEHTAATFAPAQTFLKRAASGEIILFPPQVFLLKLLTQFVTQTESGYLHFMSQREKLLSFLKSVPTAETEKGKASPLSMISWADKCISPYVLFKRSGEDGRVVLALDKPGPELKGSDRAGDWERVVLVKFGKGGPTQVEMRRREDALEEERKLKSTL